MRKFVPTNKYSLERIIRNRKEVEMFGVRFSTICKTCGKSFGDHWGTGKKKATEMNCPLYG